MNLELETRPGELKELRAIEDKYWEAQRHIDELYDEMSPADQKRFAKQGEFQ